MVDPRTILIPTDMAQSRTPHELCTWVEAKATELSRTKEGRRYARSERLPKKLMEEIRPLGLFSLYLYGDNGVRCTPNLSSDNYDGKIEFPDTSIPPHYVEITYAKDGKDERDRLQVLTEKGNVSALGKITVFKSKKFGKSINVENGGLLHSEVRERALCLVRKCLENKSNKQYGENHVLVVVVDDYLSFRTDEDKEVLMSNAKAMLTNLILKVRAVYLLGSSGKYCAQVI